MLQILSTLGIFVSLVLSLFLFWREVKRTSISEEKTIDVLFVSLVLAIVVGRLFYIGFNFQEFQPTIFKSVLIYAFPGLFEFGFWFGFFLAWFLYSRKQKLDFYQLMKMLLLPILLATTLFFFFYYLKSKELYFIYKACAFLLLLLVYRFVVIRLYKQEKISLKGLFMYFISGASLFNFVIDFFKGAAVYLFGQKVLSIEQLFYGAIFLWGAGWWFKNLLQRKK